MKTKETIYKVIVAIPLLFSLMAAIGCGSDKKSSRSTIGGTYSRGGICYQNGVQVSNPAVCNQTGVPTEINGVCYSYGTQQQLPLSSCQGGTTGVGTGQQCIGPYYYPCSTFIPDPYTGMNLCQNGRILIQCSGYDCRGYMVYHAQTLQPVQCY